MSERQIPPPREYTTEPYEEIIRDLLDLKDAVCEYIEWESKVTSTPESVRRRLWAYSQCLEFASSPKQMLVRASDEPVLCRHIGVFRGRPTGG